MLKDDRPHADDPGAWLSWTSRKQAAASDPSGSAWVSANAGSGKTHVLTQRVIRLLLAGCRPSAILCLTYTKAAASEMSNRVFERLAEWAVLSDKELAARVEQIEGVQPDSLKLQEARRLFARALETPGGLKIQTIHAFCEALLHQFPLEANVAGHFSVLDDRAAAVLLADARRSLLTATSTEDDRALADAFAAVLDIADDTGLDRLINDIVANRGAIRAFIEDASTNGGTAAFLREQLGFAPHEDAASLTGAFWPPPGFDADLFRRYIETALAAGSDTVKSNALALAAVRELKGAEARRDALCGLFFSGSGAPTSLDRAFLSKNVKSASADFEPLFNSLQEHIVACRDRLRRFHMFEATRAALVIAERLIGDYEDLKRGRSLLDFDDLIDRAAALLTRSDVGAWIHYKLDQGIDHVLVDEAQDTSPRQWAIIGALTGEFFAGASARSNATRTVFAVGDEKQSIYSFQGARPERFAEEGGRTARRAGDAAAKFQPIRLLLSFRSTRDVLSAVDTVFAVPENARGLSAGDDSIVHASNRGQEPGAVDVWDVIVPTETIDEEDWTAPFDAVPEKAPVNILARRIADTLATWIGRETVTEKGVTRPMRPGDVIVLVRKRDGFVNALTRALKQPHRIPVAGADRLMLTGHIAVQDLLALGRFALLPEDDLSLASLLKSPLFGLGEQTLFDLAASRPEQTSLWHHLQAQATEDLVIAALARRLEAFTALALELPVHDFYARVIGALGGRAAFLARLGQEAGEIIDEFLSFALDQEENGLPGLQAFISTLELEAPTVKREQDKARDEVRIMTVHAAKGLEAPVVFLVDGGGAPFTHTHMPKFRFLAGPGDGGSLPAWLPASALNNDLTDRDAERIRTQAEEEYRRLLYVGMTRAADRLVVCGYRGKKESRGTWHEMIRLGLAGDSRCSAATFATGSDEWTGQAWREADARSGTVEALPQPELELTPPLPPALGRPLPPQRHLPRPLSPSGAAAVIDTSQSDLIVASPLFTPRTGMGSGTGRSLERGRILHRFLQVLPGIAVAERKAAARRYLDRAARQWSGRDRDQLVASAIAIMGDPSLAAIFSSHGRAEVSIMGTLKLGRADYAVSGRIDRMVVTDEAVEIVDFKTNRQPPMAENELPFEHVAQLAIYRAILAPLYPGRSIRCGLVYTEAPVVYWLRPETMASSLADLATK